MNVIVWLIVGGLVGWVASILMHTNAQQGILMNVAVGIIGAFVGGYLISPMISGATINQHDFSLPSLVVSLLGAIILLMGIRLVRGGSSRW